MIHYAVWKISRKNNYCHVLGVYHPPPSDKNQSVNQDFVDKFFNIYIDLSARLDNSLITGDFNIHVNDEDDVDRMRFNGDLSLMTLTQHVSFPTHI